MLYVFNVFLLIYFFIVLSCYYFIITVYVSYVCISETYKFLCLDLKLEYTLLNIHNISKKEHSVIMLRFIFLPSHEAVSRWYMPTGSGC